MTTAVVGAAALPAAATLAAPVAPAAGATVRRVSTTAAPSRSRTHRRVPLRVREGRRRDSVRLVESFPPQYDRRSPRPSLRRHRDPGGTPTQPGRRTLMAVQPTRGRMVYSSPITVSRLQRPRGVRALLLVLRLLIWASESKGLRMSVGRYFRAPSHVPTTIGADTWPTSTPSRTRSSRSSSGI